MHCLVTGRVQGVWYRAATREQAQRLALDGWVRNLEDGSVEVVAAGEPAAIGALCAWLWQGPRAARVDSVTVEECSEAVGSGFDVR